MFISDDRYITRGSMSLCIGLLNKVRVMSIGESEFHNFMLFDRLNTFPSNHLSVVCFQV